jgi:thymidylate kinase
MIISIEGIPGSGKTTMIQLLKISKFNAYSIGSESVIDLGTGLDNLLKYSDLTLLKDRMNITESCPDTMIYLSNLSVTDKTRLIKTNNLLGFYPDYIIYLHANPETWLQRLNEKGSLTLEDLKLRYQNHDWYFNGSACDIPIYKLNTQDDLSNVLYNLIQIVKDIYYRHQETLTSEIDTVKLFEEIT